MAVRTPEMTPSQPIHRFGSSFRFCFFSFRVVRFLCLVEITTFLSGLSADTLGLSHSWKS